MVPLRDFDSIANQDIKGKFIRREVFGCFTAEVEYILSRHDANDAPFTFDDVERIYTPYCRECGEDYTRFSKSKNDNGISAYTCEDCGHEYTEEEYSLLDTQHQEIYEWWAVSGYLASKLASYGECIIDGPCVFYWGRCCTGQTILLDYIISKICEDMGILDGQPNSWAKLPV